MSPTSPRSEVGRELDIRVAVLEVVVGGLGHELAEDAHIRRVREDLVNRDVGQVLASHLTRVKVQGRFREGSGKVQGLGQVLASHLVPVLRDELGEVAQPLGLVRGQEGEEAAG